MDTSALLFCLICAGAELHGLAEAVLEEMRSKAGREVFSAAASQAELAIREQRDKRRQQRLLQVHTHKSCFVETSIIL